LLVKESEIYEALSLGRTVDKKTGHIKMIDDHPATATIHIHHGEGKRHCNSGNDQYLENQIIGASNN